MPKRSKRATAQADAPVAERDRAGGSLPLGRRRRRWLLRLCAAVLLPLLLFGATELLLRVIGYGYSTKFFETAEGDFLTTNQKFGWQFYSPDTATIPHPLRFVRTKAPGTFRIFILGESAAAGTPDPAFSFSRMLEWMLTEQYPSNRFEVINAAMRGINSHIVRHIARECAELSPDLFIIYMGNNELVGLHAPSPGEFSFTKSPLFIRLQRAAKATKLAQAGQALLRRVGSKDKGERNKEMEFFRRQRLAFDDPLRESAYRNFRANLAAICDDILRSGARALLCSVAVNVDDFPPLASLHRANLSAAQHAEWERSYVAAAQAEARAEWTEALKHLTAAATLDDHFAELQFRVGGCHRALGNHKAARKHFLLARDRDALQFRTDSRLNGITRDVAASRAEERFGFVDVENALAGAAGTKLFHEHVHFTFEGDHRLAVTLLAPTAIALGLPTPTAPPLSRDECARRLAFTSIEELHTHAAMVQLTGRPPFLDQLNHALRQARAEREVAEKTKQITARHFQEADSSYREALARRPDDWMIRFNHAALLSDAGDHVAAAREYSELVKLFPTQRKFRLSLGHALLRAGRAAEAVPHFRAAAEFDPHFAPAQEALRAALKASGLRERQ